MAYKQEINVALIVTIAAISGIMLLVIIIGMQAWYQDEAQAEADQKALEFPNLALDSLKTDQLANINKYRWVDKDKGVVAIPIDLSMKLMVDTQGNFPTTQPSTQAEAANSRTQTTDSRQ